MTTTMKTIDEQIEQATQTAHLAGEKAAAAERAFRDGIHRDRPRLPGPRGQCRSVET